MEAPLATVRPGMDSADIVRDYCLTKSPATYEALVQRCEGLVRGIASEFRTPGLHDDLVQVGFVGLLNPIEHFDPNRGTPFVLLRGTSSEAKPGTISAITAVWFAGLDGSNG